MLTRMGRLAACGALVLAAVLVPAAPAAADQCASPGTTIRPTPWPQQLFNPDGIAPFSTGAGIKVAVVDVGVDGKNQPQLAGHVLTGSATGQATGKAGNTDCPGHGTQVAGVIAAQPSTSVGFRGLAPGVVIDPIRLGDQLVQIQQGNTGQQVGIDAHSLAQGIAKAVADHVDIINISLVSTDTSELHNAINNALDQGIVVVAAGGDDGGTNGGNATAYPASYQGVIGVGAIGQDGTVTGTSEHGSWIDLVAPGMSVTTTQTGGGLITLDGNSGGTGIAAAFVSAAAALVRARFPSLTPDQVAQRLEATATPAPGGPDEGHYGFGVVDPYAAVTATLASGAPKALPGAGNGRSSRADRERAESWTLSSNLGLGLAGAGLGVALLVVLAAVAIPRGRRRRWVPGQAAAPFDHPEADLPTPPVELFKESEMTR